MVVDGLVGRKEWFVEVSAGRGVEPNDRGQRAEREEWDNDERDERDEDKVDDAMLGCGVRYLPLTTRRRGIGRSEKLVFIYRVSKNSYGRMGESFFPMVGSERVSFF